MIRAGQTVTRALLRSFALTVLVLGVSGCTTASYYAESVKGHVEIMSARRNVQRLIDDQSTSEALRARLESASAIRQFAIDELALPDNSSYRSYVDIGRDQVTVGVFAAPEFSLAPVTWCFPVFGCVPYRGYFSEKSAKKAADEVRGQGLDVYVTGITAYSTLGWSSDPLLSTMLGPDDTYLASLLFHELAHQRVYVNDDSAFNEAFAVAVEITGVRKWFRAQGATAGLSRYEASLKRRNDFLNLVAETREALTTVYNGQGTVEMKRAGKTAAIERMRARYRQIRSGRWDGFRGYDGWFDTPINNAKLAATSVYGDQVPAFIRLHDLCSGDYPRFYDAVRRLGAVEKSQRAAALQSAESCQVAGGS